MSKKIGLNFDWYFSKFSPIHLKNLNIQGWELVHLPHNAVDLPFNHFDEKMTEGLFSYVKTIELKKEWKDKSVFLRFEGVAHRCEIYLNNKLVMEHKGGYTPFEVYLNDVAQFDNLNTLLVVVDTQEHSSIPPFGGVVDFLGYGGIYREVFLLVHEKEHIKNIYVKVDPPLQFNSIKLIVHLTHKKGYLDISIKNNDLIEVIAQRSIVFEHVMGIKIDVPYKVLWSLKNPYLYTVDVAYYIDKELKDEKSERFGFRQAEFKENGFYLNGIKTKLVGMNRHQSYPYVGNAMPKRVQYEDADYLKFDLGLNMVRTAHYPQSKHFIRRCDEIGLLVFEEIPGWQHIGDKDWKDVIYQDLRAMITRDRNAPSVVLWGVRINESPDDDDFYQRTNEIAERLDPTRQTGGVRNFANSSFFEDVYTYNDFSHTGNNNGLESKNKIIKNKPYLVTEYNGHMFPTKRYDDEAKRLNHAIRHLNVLNAALDEHNDISGAIGWCMSDYNTHREFGSGDRVCYHGITDMFRIPKLASVVYKAEFNLNPMMVVSSEMNIGDYPAAHIERIFIFTNVEYVRLYKNDKYINTFYPSNKAYPNLKHPPVVIDDFIGGLLKREEKMSQKDAETTKDILKAVTQYGANLPLRYKVKTLFILKKYKMTYDEGVKMFYKYMSGWGKGKTSYRFDGYKNRQLAVSVIKEHNEKFIYELTSSRKVLFIEDTYDATRYVIRKVNQHGETINYSFDPIEINVYGSIELIGPRKVSLQGGALAFWVKSNNQRGIGKIEVRTPTVMIKDEVMVK